jgi:TrmH family RNA methyltransferase
VARSLPTPPSTCSVLSDSNARLAAARRLINARDRRETGRFLAEGVQAVREAIAHSGTVVDVFGTATALSRHADLIEAAEASGLRVSEVSEKSAAALSETMSPQGLIAVCQAVHVGLETAMAAAPRLAVVLVEANDPGNAGTIVRTADAAGADLVVFADGSVDPYNGKAVRASAGSLFHLDVVVGADASVVIAAFRRAGVHTLATTGNATTDIDVLAADGGLAGPTAWLFGNEARGLPAALITAADQAVRVPIHGRAESLNLSAAAAVCLYASAREQGRSVGGGAVPPVAEGTAAAE